MEDFSQLITKKEIDDGHQKGGKDMLVCFARKKLIQVQPEEVIRQKVIRFLVDDLGVPQQQIEAEVPMARFAKRARKRADIIVYGSNGPLLVVECKNQNITLCDEDIAQVDRYNEKVNAPYVAVSNGVDFWPYFKLKDGGKRIKLSSLNYENMIAKLVEEDEYDYVEEFETFNENEYRVSESLFDFWIAHQQLLHNDSVELRSLEGELFTLKKDLGLSYNRMGDPSGNTYIETLRNFLIQDKKGNDRIVSISHNSWKSRSKDDKRCWVYICTSVDSEKGHVLELKLDKDSSEVNGSYDLFHDGRMTVGSGVGRSLVQTKLARLISTSFESNKLPLGTLSIETLDHLDINEKSVKDHLSKLIDYSLARHQVKNEIKAERN